MDANNVPLNVPKKVNRHVLKAINALSDGKLKKAIPTMEILHRVKYQMRNLMPVRNIDLVVQESLRNLCRIGLIERKGPQRYALNQHYAASSESPSSSSKGRKLNKEQSRKRRAKTDLDEESKGSSKRKRLSERKSLKKAFQQQHHQVASDYTLDTPHFSAVIFEDTVSNNPAILYDSVPDSESLNNLNIGITEIANNYNSNSSNHLQNEDETLKNSESQLNALCSNSNSTLKNSDTATRIDQKEDDTLQKSESQLIESNSKSINPLTNSSTGNQPDIKTDTSAKPSCVTVNSFSEATENLKSVANSNSKIN